MSIETLEQLRGALVAGVNPNRAIDQAIAGLVFGYRVEMTVIFTDPDDPAHDRLVPRYTDPLVGPGALFAEVWQKWPGATFAVASNEGLFFCRAALSTEPEVSSASEHVDLARAIALGVVEELTR